MAAKVTAAFSLAVGGAALAVGVTPASAAPLDGSAFGLSANVTIGDEEVVDLAPTPAVDCPSDDESETVLSVSLPEALPEVPGVPLPMDTILDSGTLTAECSTVDGVVTSTASVEDLNLFDEITASVLEAECTANGDPTGDATVTDLVLEGEVIEVTGEPNQMVDIPSGVGTVTINRQTVTDNPDGTSTITVEALVVDLDVPAGGGIPGVTADLIVSSVSCTSSIAVMEPPVTEPPVTEPPTTEPPTTEPPTTEPPTTEPPTTEAPGPIDEAPPAEPIPDDADFTG